MQVYLTVAAGKELIAQAVAKMAVVQEKLREGSVVICGGTTNNYVARAILAEIGETVPAEANNRMFRGVTVPAGAAVERFEGNVDILIRNGVWEKDVTLIEAVDSLKPGDVIIKGGNAVDLESGDVGVMIGNGEGGTVMQVTRAAIGHRAYVIAPVGLEKRVSAPITDLMELINDPEAQGLRMALLPGKAFTELEAIEALTGAYPTLIGGGGVLGAEGGVYLLLSGEEEELQAARELLNKVKAAPAIEQ